MIKEAFVKYETAKLLEYYGFKQNTMAFYVDCDETEMSYYDPLSKNKQVMVLKRGDFIDPNDQTIQDYQTKGKCISAPTHQMAMAFLRTHDNYICLTPIINEGQLEIRAKIQYVSHLGSLVVAQTIVSKSYDECVESAIKWCLENIF